MQFSLPISTFPMPAGPSAGAGNTAGTADSAAKESGDPLADCFESFLSDETPAEEPEAKEAGDDTEQAAALFAASFWAPVVTSAVPPPTQLSLSATPEVVESAEQTLDQELPVLDSTGVSSARQFPVTSRAFAPTLPEKAAAVLPQTNLANATDKPNVKGDREPRVLPATPGRLIATDAPGQAVAAAAIANDATVQPTSFAVKPIVLPKRTFAVPDASLPTSTNEAAAETEASPAIPVMEAPAMPVTEAPFAAPDLANSDAEAAVPVTINLPMEKIAARPLLPDDYRKQLPLGREKQFLSSVDKQVTAVSDSVGISVAKVSATMPAAAPARSKSASVSESTTAFSFSAETASVATLLTPEAPTPVATVRETMAAVISAVEALERKSDVQQKSVDLQFHVGDEKLGLRVELRDGTVHTTFRTESSEMNGALTREWQAVVQPALARDIRLADPVFNSSNSAQGDSAFGSLGQGTPHQREQKAPSAFSSSFKRELYDSGIVESAPVTSPAANSSQLLNVLA